MLKFFNILIQISRKQKYIKEYQNKIETKFTMVNGSLNDIALCIDV